MAYTQAQLAALEAAIAKGVTSVQLGDERVQYRSLEEMRRIRREIQQELGLKPAGRKFVPQTSAGWRS